MIYEFNIFAGHNPFVFTFMHAAGMDIYVKKPRTWHKTIRRDGLDRVLKEYTQSEDIRIPTGSPTRSAHATRGSKQ